MVDFRLLEGGSTFTELSAADLKSIHIPFPSITEQDLIADYLDRETARLDALVTEKVRLLSLLQKKRQALITRAVTRGLNPAVPFRDSCIDWLGDIPAHWESRKIAWLFRERDQRGQSDLPLLEVSLKSGGVQREFTGEKIETTAADFHSYKVARKGDVVYNKMRMWQGAVGVAPVDGLVSPDYIVGRADRPPLVGVCRVAFQSTRFQRPSARDDHTA